MRIFFIDNYKNNGIVDSLKRDFLRQDEDLDDEKSREEKSSSVL